MAIAPVLLPAKPAPPLSPLTVASFSKTILLEHCKTPRDLHQIHARLIKAGAAHLPSVTENLLECSALILPGNLHYALDVFRAAPSPHAQAYNILIRAFTRHSSPQEALALFLLMLGRAVPPDEHTFSCVLKACCRLCARRYGKQVHAHALKRGFGSEEFVVNSLIHMYASCGEVGVARNLFERMPERGIVTWNAMIAGYFKAGDWADVIELFRGMLHLGVAFDEITLISVLTACGRMGVLELGEWICGYMNANGLKRCQNLVTALIDMYAKCGEVDKARSLFDEMPDRDVVAWSAMISGYTQANRCREALALFHDMQKAKMEPNEVTMVSVLSSCADLGALETGKWVHSYIKRKQLHVTVNLGTALVDFYAKCGCMENALEAFDEMPSRNAWSWSVLIQGLASNGQGREALEVFSSMLEAKLQPTEVTFIGVLSACSHAGLVEEGRNFFRSMSKKYGIEPRIEHYGCMVDLFGRAGLIEEAYHFIKNMPIEPNAIVWRTLLASCKVHKNVEFGEESLKNIIKLEPRHSGDYILLSNIYASVGRWEDAVSVRNQMKEKGIVKIPGCSLIELEGKIFEFFAEDSSHPESNEIYEKVNEIVLKIKQVGYVPITAEARLDAEEDEKEVSVSHHSEKLAIAFGLMKSPPGAIIRLSKNLRVCADCHLATKLISKVYGREIVVRDRNRFHHFKDGSCSLEKEDHQLTTHSFSLRVAWLFSSLSNRREESLKCLLMAMERTWLITSRGIARKVKNGTCFPNFQIEDDGVEGYLECPNCKHLIDNSDVVSDWPGLPAGVKFDPSDVELLEHLAAKIGCNNSKPHKLIDEFIPMLEGEDGICYTHPQNLPGAKKDGSSVHFFHKISNAYGTGHRKRRKISQCGESEECVRWHKTGKTKHVLDQNGVHKGWKKIMVLYKSSKGGSKAGKANWVMHQYHIGPEEDEMEGEVVVSKLFYQQMMTQTEKKSEMEMENEKFAARVDPRTPNTNTPQPPRLKLEGSPFEANEHNLPLLLHEEEEIRPTTGENPKWWTGKSQAITTDDLNPCNLLCNEAMDALPHNEDSSHFTCSSNINCSKNEKTEEITSKNEVSCEFPDLDNILIDTPPDFQLTDLQFGSQESMSWLDQF
ncbi:hypothetical protein Cni_G21573 [Canna indica]|uniref:NAC domain-containing protein n=1 Tax=Canna indica TaxID=4628 RepID=A0AAQ3KQF4_9LILI|nr:hypothetical protein Cni_G21573 [Canna indica]